MNADKKISILLPAYNREQYLPIAIESVLAQTYKNWELLISDNCSSDSSFEIAQKYAKQDKRIICWQNEINIGPMLNYNKCIEKTSGEYIELFGDDDIFEPTCLEKLVQVLDHNPDVVMAVSAKRHIDHNGKQIREDRPRSGSQLIMAEDVISSTIGTLTNWIISPVMFRSKYKDAGFDTSLGIYADLDYWARILKYGNLFYIDEILFNYRVHTGSETSRMLNDIEFVISLLRIAERYPKYLCAQNEQDNIHKPVIEKLMALVEYASNYLKLNYDSVLKPLDKERVKSVGNNVLGNRSQELANQELYEDLHDYKRIGYLALLQAVEQKKELDWLCEQYNSLLGHTHNGNERLPSSKEKKDILDRENIHNYMRALAAARAENEALQRRIDELALQLDSVFTSQSWKITAPLRMMKKGMPSER